MPRILVQGLASGNRQAVDFTAVERRLVQFATGQDDAAPDGRQFAVYRTDRVPVSGGIQGPGVGHRRADDDFIEATEGCRVEDAATDPLLRSFTAGVGDTATVESGHTAVCRAERHGHQTAEVFAAVGSVDSDLSEHVPQSLAQLEGPGWQLFTERSIGEARPWCVRVVSLLNQ